MIDFNALFSLMDVNTVLASLCWITAGIFTLAQKYAPKGKKPWSIILSFIGREINAEIIQSCDELSKRIDGISTELSKTQESIMETKDTINKVQDFELETRAIAARVRILRFGDELQEDKKLSKGRFDQALADINSYDKYCAEHSEFKNGVTEPTSTFIKEQYQERLRKHDFSR